MADYRWLVVAMPAGWATSDGLVHKRLGEPGEVTFSGWTVQGIYDDPCRWQESRLSDLDLRDDRVHENFHDVAIGSTGPKPRQGGLANQTGRNASALTSVSFGGVPTLKIELSVPADLDLGTCDQGEFRSWNGWRAAASINAHHAPGQVDVVYMVDLDRAPLVIDASHRPAASESDLAELEAILGSMVVDRGP